MFNSFNRYINSLPDRTAKCKCKNTVITFKLYTDYVKLQLQNERCTKCNTKLKEQ